MNRPRLGISPGDVAAFRIDVVNSEASALVRQGLAIMASAEAGKAARALACFDRALDLRRDLPIATSPFLQYDLAGTWLNRASALMSLGGTEAVETAMGSYDIAIAMLRELPLDSDAQFARRLVIAYQNRALARRRLGRDGSTGAKQDLMQALATLERCCCDDLPDRPHLSGAVWLSLADLDANEPEETAWRRAIRATDRARQLVQDIERQDVTAAEIGLLARHLCCRAVARCLSRVVDATAAVPEDVHIATDAADEGLELARFWEGRGLQRFRDLAEDLFKFGERAYGVFQPHFVAEFLAEHAAPGAAPDVLPRDAPPD